MWLSYIRSEHLAVAVAARDIKRASDFAEKHRISKAYGNYEELAQDSRVEIAYVGVTAPQHLQVVKIMLNAGIVGRIYTPIFSFLGLRPLSNECRKLIFIHCFRKTCTLWETSRNVFRTSRRNDSSC